MPKKKGRRRKSKTHVEEAEEDGSALSIPRSFVLKRGDVPHSLRDLVPDTRKMLMPHTALHLRERKHGKLKDYFSVAGKLGVSHFWLMSCTEVRRELLTERCVVKRFPFFLNPLYSQRLVSVS